MSSVTCNDFLPSVLSMLGRASTEEFCRAMCQPITPDLCENAAVILGHLIYPMTSFPSLPGWRQAFIPSLNAVLCVSGTHLCIENRPQQAGKYSVWFSGSFLARKQNTLGRSICRMSRHGRHCEEPAWVHRRIG